MSTFLKAERIVSAALGLLARETVLPRLVWRDAAGDFAGAKNDTISIRLPAYASARSRDLRSGTARTRDSLTERKVDVTLDTDVYKDVRMTDEELSLDITDFGTQVLSPVVAGIARKLEDLLVTTVSGAAYAKSIAYTYASGNAWTDLILAARERLNKARVPMAGRVLGVGSGIETELLSTDLFIKANESGGTSAVTDAVIGRKAGFEIVSVPSLDPDEAYAFHRTAYVMSQRAPIVPAGAPFGASQSFDGMAIRAVRVLDPDTIEDILAMDAWTGSNVVTDDGYFDANDVFSPAEGALGTPIAVTGQDLDDNIDAVAHGLANGARVVFTGLTGGSGLVANRAYFVINAAADLFQVAATPGGAAVSLGSDITAGNVTENGTALLVRSVKVTAS